MIVGLLTHGGQGGPYALACWDLLTRLHWTPDQLRAMDPADRAWALHMRSLEAEAARNRR